jgi:hypothetical protein
MVERYLNYFIIIIIKLSCLFFVNRGKRKLAQMTKEAKEQLADLQSKLEMANKGIKKNFFFLSGFFNVKFIKRNDGKRR